MSIEAGLLLEILMDDEGHTRVGKIDVLWSWNSVQCTRSTLRNLDLNQAGLVNAAQEEEDRYQP